MISPFNFSSLLSNATDSPLLLGEGLGVTMIATGVECWKVSIVRIKIMGKD